MRRTILLLTSVAGSVAVMVAAEANKHNVKPKVGYVPDAKTAIRIAVAVWEPIYGEEQISKQRPYKAALTNGIWTVEGSMPKLMLGGVAVAEIAKDDARIIRVSHGR